MVARLSEVVGEFVSDHVLERTEELLDRSEREGRRLSREDFEEALNERTRLSAGAGKLGAGIVSLLAGHDVEIGLDVATNAVENNLIPGLVVGGLMAWEAYELVQTLRHEGVEAAALRLGFTVGTAIVGGVAMKGLWKMGKIIAPTAGEAIALYMAEHPVLGKLVEKGMDLASKGMDKFRQFDGKLDHAVGKIIPTKWKAGKQNVVKTWEGSGAVETQGLDDRITKGFYNPHEFQAYLKGKYGEENVISTTVPLPTQKNVRLAGQRHPVTGVVFDQRGFPIFDDVACFDTKISRDVAGIDHSLNHMRNATSQLKSEILENNINKAYFNESQIADIMLTKPKVEGLTWHHHQDFSRMQLIPEEIHINTGHVGGAKLWPYKKD